MAAQGKRKKRATTNPQQSDLDIEQPKPQKVEAEDQTGSLRGEAGDAKKLPEIREEVNAQYDQNKFNKANRQEFFLPVTGFMWLYREEVKIVDHPAFQRLAKIYQLGQAHLVYRGATHMRIEHVLGTVNIAQRMIDAIEHNSKKLILRDSQIGVELSSFETRFVRLGALLHDIGHMAAGHTVEDELGLVGKHDGDARLELVFTKEEWRDVDGLTLAQRIDREYADSVPEQLKALNVTASQITQSLIRKESDEKEKAEETPIRVAAEILASSAEIRMTVCRDIIGNTICADILDYLHRDWYHVGKVKPFDERILQYMEIRGVSKSVKRRAPEDKFVISLGKSPKIRTDAVSAILELLESRYSFAETVLFHRTKLTATAMLDRALHELWGDSDEDLEEIILPLSDEELISKALQHAEDLDSGKGKIAASLLHSLKNRQLYSGFVTAFYADLSQELRDRIIPVYGESPTDSPKLAPKNRGLTLTNLELDFVLPPGSLAMYCPGKKMNAKIAEVKIAVGDRVAPLNEYEEGDDGLTGGHLRAQLRRFARLWRIQIVMSPEAMELRRAILPLLQHAIDVIVLGKKGVYENPDSVTQLLAKLLTTHRDSPWHGRVLKPEGEREIAAHAAPETAQGAYPNGAATIRSYIADSDEN